MPDPGAGSTYGEWLGAEQFDALRTGKADPADGLGDKDATGLSAIEREFVGTRLHAAAVQLAGNLADDMWKIRYLQDVAMLLKAVLNGRADLEAARGLLRRIREWDHMDSAGDGPCWRSEIARVLNGK